MLRIGDVKFIDEGGERAGKRRLVERGTDKIVEEREYGFECSESRGLRSGELDPVFSTASG